MTTSQNKVIELRLFGQNVYVNDISLKQLNIYLLYVNLTLTSIKRSEYVSS